MKEKMGSVVPTPMTRDEAIKILNIEVEGGDPET